MNKKTKVLIIITSIIILSFVVFFFMPKTLAKMCDLSISDKTILEIINGNNGNVTKIEDKHRIQKIFSLLSQTTATFQLNQMPRGGFSYALMKYENGREIFSITINNGAIYSDRFYYTTDKNLADEIKKLIK